MHKLSLNIFHKLLLTLLLVTLIPLLSLWYIGSAAASRDLSYNISQNLVSTMNTIATSINAWDDSNQRVLRQAASLDDIVSMKGERHNPVLKSIAANYEWAYLIHTMGPDGFNIGRSDDTPLLNYGDRAHFKAVMSGQPSARQVAIGKTSGLPALLLSGPITGKDGTRLGVITMAMFLTEISRTVTDTRIGKTGHAILLDADYKVIAHGRPEKVKSTLQDFSKHPALAIEGVTQKPGVYLENGKQVVAFVRKLPQGWNLLVVQDYDEAFASLAAMESNAKLLILITTVLVVAIAYFLGKQLTRPINHLTAVAEELSSGKFDSAIPQTSRGDEIGSLARAVERMGFSIRLAMERLRYSKAA